MSSFLSWSPVFLNRHLALGKTIALTLVVVVSQIFLNPNPRCSTLICTFLYNVFANGHRANESQKQYAEKKLLRGLTPEPQRSRPCEGTYTVISGFRSPKKI